MAHFAKLGSDSVVTQVVVVNNAVILDGDGVEQESLGVAFLTTLLSHSNWKQTSYNGTFRKNFAGIGFSYDAGRNAFIPPKPHNSWVLNGTTCLWGAPTAEPDDSRTYIWNEDTLAWEEGYVSL